MPSIKYLVLSPNNVFYLDEEGRIFYLTEVKDIPENLTMLVPKTKEASDFISKYFRKMPIEHRIQFAVETSKQFTISKVKDQEVEYACRNLQSR